MKTELLDASYSAVSKGAESWSADDNLPEIGLLLQVGNSKSLFLHYFSLLVLLAVIAKYHYLLAEPLVS